MTKSVIRPWETVASKPMGDYRVFKVREETRISPRTHVQHNFFVIDAANWVNVIAVTAKQELVMVQQYRHGTGRVELEIPGGIIDATDASPLSAGLRELREETGYAGAATTAQLLGKISPNPAIMSNTCYTVLVQDCELKDPVEFDDSEDIQTRLVPVGEIPKLVADGVIQHALVVVALNYFDLWRKGLIATQPAGS